MEEKMKEYISDLSEWIKERQKDLNYSLEQFDKLIITLASGGLVFTTGFVKDIVKITVCTNTCLLKLTWFSFACSLVSILLGQIFSYYANKKIMKIKQNELNILETDCEYDDQTIDVKKANRIFMFYNQSIKFLNFLSVLALILGIIFFIIFININI
jgi:hypothetical protein